MPIETILWRRLDTAGHDACQLRPNDTGWALDGTAVFREDGVPARISYVIVCDQGWRTTRWEIHGWVGDRPVNSSIERAQKGTWTLNGTTVPGLEAYEDLDLGVTPATNLPQLRRVGLATGQAAEIPVAWFDVSAVTLTVLPQRYERRTQDSYWYESPATGYEALLEVGPSGFVHHYPGLWEEVER